METVHVIPEGYGVAAALLPEGWLAAATVLHDFDSEYLAEFGHDTVSLRDGKSEGDWSSAFASARRRLVLVTSTGGRVEQKELAQAERLDGPAVEGGEEPAVVWTERNDGMWRLMLWAPDSSRSVWESERGLRAPSLARVGDELLMACECSADDGDVVCIWGACGRQILATEGRRPQLAATGHGRGYLVVERANPSGLGLVAREIAGEKPGTDIPLPAAGDYNFNVSLASAPGSGALYAVWESCPSWGFDERVGLHRDISLWMLEPGGSEFKPGPGTSGGFVRIPPEAFLDASTHNFTSIRPVLFLMGNRPAIAFRRFRFTGYKCYGWDTFLMRWAGEGWTGPDRVSPNSGQPDVGYAVLAQQAQLLGFSPCCDHRPIRTFDEEARGEPGTGRTMFAENHRVEVVRFGAEEALPLVPYPYGRRACYAVSPSVPEVAPEPPMLDDPPEGLTLVWGDLHAHSAYSKCMSANDGLPRDVLRLQRDAFGCRVLCLTEHIEYMTSPEFTHVLDSVEAEAGEHCVPLFGMEWSKRPAHHTNFYAIDRGTFDRLRALLLTCNHLSCVYERIKGELPPGSVTAIRHMHGDDSDEFGVTGRRVTETHDPVLERAMEAMQTRGNMMVGEPQFGLFPSNFLNAGAKLGLVGGSDHSRGGGPNRFCLTGFWVAELTPESIFEALVTRRTIATSNGKVAIYATVAGAPMGESVSVSVPVRVRVQIACATAIRRVCLMRDGQLLEWTDVGAKRATIQLADENVSAGRHWYVVTAEADSVLQSPPVLAHASPFFVEVR